MAPRTSRKRDRRKMMEAAGRIQPDRHRPGLDNEVFRNGNPENNSAMSDSVTTPTAPMKQEKDNEQGDRTEGRQYEIISEQHPPDCPCIRRKVLKNGFLFLPQSMKTLSLVGGYDLDDTDGGMSRSNSKSKT